MSEPELTIVVEAKSDADLLRLLLGKELASRTRFFAGQGKISLASLARNIFVHEGGPVLVVRDADTTNPQLVEEQKGFTRLALARVASPEDYDVFYFVPEIEVVFFESHAALHKLIGHDASAETLREGVLLPKPTLTTLLGGTPPPYAKFEPTLGELLAAGKQASAFKASVLRFLTQHAEA
jgi:hypothetical protein